MTSGEANRDVDPVLVERSHGWATITLMRPHRRNALTGPLVNALRAAVENLGADDAVSAIVLNGSEGAFCSGVDLTELQRQPAPDWVAGFSQAWRDANIALYRCPCPVVVALERYGINAGAALALAGDIVVAGEDSFLQIGEIRQGAPMPMNAAWLALKVGEGVAGRLAYMGDRVPANELLRLGLVQEVVPGDQVANRAVELAQQLAEHPPGSSRRIKASLRSNVAVDPDTWFAASNNSALLTAQQLKG